MDFFLTLSQRNGLAACGRDQVDLADFFVAVFIVVVGIGILFGRGFALGEEGNPAAVGRPLGLGVVTGLRELNQRGSVWRSAFRVVAVEPEIGRKIFWSQSARSVAITTELPSGEMATLSS